MGFYRQGQPTARDRAITLAAARRYLAQEVAFESFAGDPFGIEQGCINPAGHHFNGACGDVVCLHCRRMAWA